MYTYTLQECVCSYSPFSKKLTPISQMITSKTAKNNKLKEIKKTQIFTNFGFISMPLMFICWNFLLSFM